MSYISKIIGRKKSHLDEIYFGNRINNSVQRLLERYTPSIIKLLNSNPSIVENIGEAKEVKYEWIITTLAFVTFVKGKSKHGRLYRAYPLIKRAQNYCNSIGESMNKVGNKEYIKR